MNKSFIVSSSACKNCGKEGHSRYECEFKVAWQINPHMRIGQVSPRLAHGEHKNFIDALKATGASISRMPFVHGAFDSVFAKDNAVIIETDSGVLALLGRPMTEERLVEQNNRRTYLEKIGVTVVGQSRHHLEGGDVVVSPDGSCVFLGYGFRTDLAVVSELEHFLEQKVVALELKDPHFYHLDTALALTPYKDGLMAFAYKDAFTDEAWERLQVEPSILGCIEVTRDEALKFGLNWVEVNDEILIGSEVPLIAASLSSLCKKVSVTPLTQFQLAGGSAACLVSQIHDRRSLNQSDRLQTAWAAQGRSLS